MVKGVVRKNRPIVELVVIGELKAQRIIALVDTGFTGELKISAKEALDLEILPEYLQPVKLADGKMVQMWSSSARVSMEGVKNSVEVLISNSIPTIGVGLLKLFGYNLNIDFKKDILLLQKDVT